MNGLTGGLFFDKIMDFTRPGGSLSLILSESRGSRKMNKP